MQTYPVFVYGTLRKGGIYHALLMEAPLIKENYHLPGYRLYAYQHWFPYMVRGEAEDVVIGEVYHVDEITVQKLNELEEIDKEVYRLVYLQAHEFYAYLKFDHDVSGLKWIPEGDWIQYVRRNGKAHQ